MDEAVRMLTYHVPGYRFMESFKMGRWNGTIKLCKPTGKTYLNLLPKILPVIEAAGYSFDIIDDRRKWDIKIDPIGNDLFAGLKSGRFEGVMEEHQVAAINTIIQTHKGILELATGAGKTVTTAGLAKLYAPFGRVLIIVPRIDLAVETQICLRDLKVPCGIIFGEAKDIQHVTVSTWQSLANIPEAFHDVVAVITDEVHTAKAKELHEILTGPGRNVPVRIGMTGTMPEVDLYKDEIIASIGNVVFSKPAWELQREGFLAHCNVVIHKFLDSLNPDHDKVAYQFQNFWDVLSWQANDEARMCFLASLLDTIAETGNTLILVRKKEFGEALADTMPGAVFMHGSASAKKRVETYREVNADDDRILICTYGIAQFGINIPRIFNLVLVEPGKDPIGIVQSIGRSLRRADDKDHAVIHMIMSDGPLMRGHVSEVKRILRKSKYPFQTREYDYVDIVREQQAD